MLRVVVIALLTLPTLAGCIALPEDAAAQEFEPAAAPEADRIAGMTAFETHTDAIVDCSDASGGVRLPPQACAERKLSVVGRIGVTHLPIDLSAANGEVVIAPSEGDAWSFQATYRVSALTEDMARDGLDTAWSWSHEEGGVHRLRAGPTGVTGIEDLRARVSVATYRVELPRWVLIDLKAETDNGGIVVAGFEMGVVDATSDNGRIELYGAAREVRASTDNGQLVLRVTPRGGALDLTTDNGQITVQVPAGPEYGFDVRATTGNGQVVIDLPDGELRETQEGAGFRTRGFEARGVRTTMTLATDNGQVIVRAE